MRRYESVKIDILKPYKNNARTHSEEQVDKIVRSIEEFGFINPVLIDGDFGIIAGHGRVMAAKKMGMTEVPCLFVEDLTEAQKRAYIIADNKLALDAGWDEHILQIELAELQDMDFDITLTGFELDDIEDDEPQEVVEDDYEVEPPEEPRTKKGDIWQLGRHRLMCGDSTDMETVEQLLDGAEIDLVMTDPPYGINAEKMTMGSGAKDFHRGEDWDSERPDISIAFAIAPLVCIWGGNYFADSLPVTNDWLCWWKKNDGLSFSEFELAWTNFGRNCRHIAHHWGGEKKLHVTMKPLEVIAWAIQQTKEKCETIVDLFGGSGSTLIACEQLDRTCYMMELDEKYCDVIIDRWEQFTGEKAVLLNG